MRQFMLRVPNDYLEIGANRRVWRVQSDRPGCPSRWCESPPRPLAILIFLYHWNDLFWPLLVMRQQTSYTLSQALYYLQGAYGTNYHLKLAAAALVVCRQSSLYLVAQKQIMRGVLLPGEGLTTSRLASRFSRWSGDARPSPARRASFIRRRSLSSLHRAHRSEC